MHHVEDLVARRRCGSTAPSRAGPAARLGQEGVAVAAPSPGSSRACRCVWITALGEPVVPEVNRNFATVSGPDGGVGGVHRRRVGGGKLGEGDRRRPGTSPVSETTGTSPGTTAAMAGGERAASSAKTSAGGQSAPRCRAACGSRRQSAHRPAPAPPRGCRHAARRAPAAHGPMELPDRISSGRSGDSPSASRAPARSPGSRAAPAHRSSPAMRRPARARPSRRGRARGPPNARGGR